MSVKTPPAMAKANSLESTRKGSSAKKKQPSKVSNTKPKQSGLSEARVVDSDSDDQPAPKLEEKGTHQATAPTHPKSVPAKLNGVKRKVEESDSSHGGSESSSSNVDSGEQPQAKKLKKLGDQTNEESSSEEDESSDDDSSSDDNLGEQDEAPTAAEVTLPAKPTMQSIPAPAFDPPPGYTALDATSSPLGSLFSGNALAGKQMWHISAPSNVPVTSIEKIAAQALQDGSPVLQHKGLHYVLADAQNHDRRAQRVLVPTQLGYQLIEPGIQRTIKLQQMIKLPNLSKLQANTLTGSSAAADVGRAAVSSIRPQPKGLRMRYKPPGFGLGSPELETDDEEDRSATANGLQFPETLGAHGASDKPDVEERSKRKDKREKKKRKSGDVVMADASIESAARVAPATKNIDERKEEGPTLGKSVAENVANGLNFKETLEEKMMRKEAKRARKEAKRKASEDFM